MKLEVTSIANANDIESERIVLRAGEDLDLGSFAIFSCVIMDDDRVQSGNIPDVFWFEDEALKKGDLVILYTKSGIPRRKESKSGAVSYFYYWDRDEAIWTSTRRAIAVNTADWSAASDQPQLND